MPKLNPKSKKSNKVADNVRKTDVPPAQPIDSAQTTDTFGPTAVTLEVTNGAGALLLRQNTYQCGSAADVFSVLQKLTKILRNRRRREKSRTT